MIQSLTMRYIHLAYKDWGRIDYETSIKVGDNRKVQVSDLLKETLKALAEYNISYRKKISLCEFPLQWGERQNLGPMFLALYNATDGTPILSELPLKLRDVKNPKFIDYWLLIKKKVLDVLIEYKHGNIQLKTEFTIEDDKPFFYWKWLKDNWKSDCDKLESISMKDIKTNFEAWDGEEIRKPIKIGLLVTPVFQESKLGNTKLEKERFTACKDKFARLLSPPPNWEAIWWFPENRQKTEIEPYRNDKGDIKHYNHYRGLYFFARIFE